MSSLPNSHAALLKNRDLLQGHVALIGLSDPALLSQIPCEGDVVTDHFGTYGQMAGVPRWRAVFGYFDPEMPRNQAQTAVVFMPKAKAELALRLDLASTLLAGDGQLILVGEKREGIASATKQLQLRAPEAFKVDSARHCQVWQAAVPGSKQALALETALSWHCIEVAGTGIDVAGLPGVFSDGRLDDGTRRLLETLAEKPVKGPVLDFACGAGVVGGWLYASGGLQVDGVDVQAQAVTCARETYLRSGASGQIIAGDGLGRVEGRYQTIVTNPPFHSGVRTDTSMTIQFLRQASAHMVSGGELRLVANSFLPYADLIREHVGPCEVLSRDPKFTVYCARRH